MAYFVLATVKDRINITNANQDGKINSYGADADAFVNEQLAKFEAVVPVGGDTHITSLANQLTIAFYYWHNNPSLYQPVNDAKKEIKDYIVTHYRKDVAGIEKTSWTGKTTGTITGTE